MSSNKYQDGLIYTIKTDNGLYVGSTCDFANRKREHKSCIYDKNKVHYDIKLYKNIRENSGDYSIEIYKMFPCNSDVELRMEEEEVRKFLSSNLNMVRAFRSKEEEKQYQKEYRNQNKEYIIEYMKEYHQKYKKQKEEIITCECGSKICRSRLTEHRKTQVHLNLMNGIKHATTITCECGCQITKGVIARHRKSKRHIKLMKLKMQPKAASSVLTDSV